MTFNLPVLFFLPRLWGLMSPKVGTGVKVAVPRHHLNSHHIKWSYSNRIRIYSKCFHLVLLFLRVVRCNGDRCLAVLYFSALFYLVVPLCRFLRTHQIQPLNVTGPWWAGNQTNGIHFNQAASEAIQRKLLNCILQVVTHMRRFPDGTVSDRLSRADSPVMASQKRRRR